MVPSSPLGRFRVVPGCLLCLCVCWACFSALPALASAEPGPEFTPPEAIASEPALPEFADCPEGVESPYEGSEDAAAEQLTLFRSEAAQSCRAEADRLSEVLKRLWWLTAESVVAAAKRQQSYEQLNDNGFYTYSSFHKLEKVVEDLEQEKGLPVKVGSLPELPSGSQPIGTVEVSNTPDAAALEGVQTAQEIGNQTGNQNLWSLAGLVVGFGFLMILWKLLRP